MKRVLEHEHVVVYDDVLSADDLAALRRHVGGENYSTPMVSNGGWVRAWRPNDGEPLCTRDYVTGEEPFPHELRCLVGPAQEAAARHPSIVGAYAELVFRSYLYRRGTRISWHADHYAGALTFYAHPEWGATWGGELLIVDARDWREFAREHPRPPEWLAPSWEEDYLAHTGVGIWIAPKPNRLVLAAPSAYHSVNRVDDDAGSHVRASVVGFYRNRPS